MDYPALAARTGAGEVAGFALVGMQRRLEGRV